PPHHIRPAAPVCRVAAHDQNLLRRRDIVTRLEQRKLPIAAHFQIKVLDQHRRRGPQCKSSTHTTARSRERGVDQPSYSTLPAPRPKLSTCFPSHFKYASLPSTIG